MSGATPFGLCTCLTGCEPSTQYPGWLQLWRLLACLLPNSSGTHWKVSKRVLPPKEYLIFLSKERLLIIICLLVLLVYYNRNRIWDRHCQWCAIVRISLSEVHAWLYFSLNQPPIEQCYPILKNLYFLFMYRENLCSPVLFWGISRRWCQVLFIHQQRGFCPALQPTKWNDSKMSSTCSWQTLPTVSLLYRNRLDELSEKCMLT